MLNSKLELLVDWGASPDQSTVTQTLEQLKKIDGVSEAQYKDGALVVDSCLPSAEVLGAVEKIAGRRTVLQGFGEKQSAVAMVSGDCGSPGVVGVVRFQQSSEGPLVVDGTLDGLPSGEHGLHVHEAGDLSEGCQSLGKHFDPRGVRHGSPDDSASERHAGDLGNIVADENGRATFRIVDSVLKVWDIVGRSVAVSERRDDLGRGKSPTSHIDGDSGPSIACGVIARSAGVFQNPKRVCACDGVVVWDERERPLAGSGRRKPCCQGEGDKHTDKDCGGKETDAGLNAANEKKDSCCKNKKNNVGSNL